ncbi:MAG: protein-glutamate O-methyltransferase CheR [Calditrichaeota bacterium]|nr:MAG: protein-glutamate O-methyltransferase CheR [Calditrichota bacterium]
MSIETTQEIAISQEDYELIRDYIHEKCGIYFADNKMYLVKNRLSKRMHELGIKNYRDYFYHVKYDTTQKEFAQLMNVITTNETSFFRNEPQLLSFAEEALPLTLKEKAKSGKKTIKIWSAGCSTGEEPYTLAIILLEKLREIKDWKIEIIANDISEQVLTRARTGIYSGQTLRNMKSDILLKYFIKQDEEYRVKPEVKSLINFSHMNLNDIRRSLYHNNFDYIFCRNVMIYFSEEVKKTLVRNFFDALNPKGYLYIGHAETLHNISKAFKLVYFKNALVYHKEDVNADSSKESSAGISIRRPTFLTKNEEDPAAGASRAIDLLSKIKQTQSVGTK